MREAAQQDAAQQDAAQQDATQQDATNAERERRRIFVCDTCRWWTTGSKDVQSKAHYIARGHRMRDVTDEVEAASAPPSHDGVSTRQ